MMLRPGFRVIIDKGEPLDGKYDMCFQNACSAEIEIGPKTLEALKKGQNMSVVMRVPGGDVSGRELTFNIPLKDFGPAFDGKPTDPKVLEQQRQALQQQLQKKAEEQRKMLEQQQSSGAAPAAPAPAPRRRPPLRRSRLRRASRADGRLKAGSALRSSAQARAGAGAISAVVRPFEDFAHLRMPNRLAGFVRHQILLGNIGDVLAVRVLGIEVIERLFLGGAHLGGDRTPPFLGVGEDRVDVEDHTAEWVEPVFDDLSNPEFRRASSA